MLTGLNVNSKCYWPDRISNTGPANFYRSYKFFFEDNKKKYCIKFTDLFLFILSSFISKTFGDILEVKTCFKTIMYPSVYWPCRTS